MIHCGFFQKFFLQTVHSKQANSALKRKELLKTKKREEWKGNRATPQLLGQGTKHHVMNNFTHHTAKAAVVLLGGRTFHKLTSSRHRTED